MSNASAYNKLSFGPFKSITITPTPTVLSSNFDFLEFDDPEESYSTL
jgi:hypothetical protein